MRVLWRGSSKCSVVTQDIEISFKLLKKLITFNDQKEYMNSGFLYTGYGVALIGEKVHPFMTKGLIAIRYTVQTSKLQRNLTSFSKRQQILNCSDKSISIRACIHPC